MCKSARAPRIRHHLPRFDIRHVCQPFPPSQHQHHRDDQQRGGDARRVGQRADRQRREQDRRRARQDGAAATPSCARSGASATHTASASGNRFPSPTPITASPASVCAGLPAGHRTAKPSAATPSATASRRAPGSARARRLPVTRPTEHAAEVAEHQRDRGVGGDVRRLLGERRAPGGDAPLGRDRAEHHRRGDVEGAGQAARVCSVACGRLDRTSRCAGRRPRHRERDEQRRPPAQRRRRRQRERADQHHVGGAREDVGLGQRDGAEARVVVGEQRLDGDQQRPRRRSPPTSSAPIVTAGHAAEREAGEPGDITAARPHSTARRPTRASSRVAVKPGDDAARSRTRRRAARRSCSRCRARHAGAGRPGPAPPAGRRTRRAARRPSHVRRSRWNSTRERCA